MKTSSPQLKADARGHLAGRYGVVITAYMLATLLTNIPSLILTYTLNTNTLAGSFIDVGVTKEFLKREWKRALEEKTTPNCRISCSGCGAKVFEGGVCFENKN